MVCDVCEILAGLSFYTSEKTLRAAFEGFGELVEGTYVNYFRPYE